MRSLTAVLCACAVVAGCSEAFDPTADGPRPFVVFALLNSSLDTQIVRVHLTSPPTEQHPPVQPVPGTQVTLKNSSIGEIPGEPTMLIPPAGSSDTTSIQAFRVPFRPGRGQTYALEVVTPQGTATGTAAVPGAAALAGADIVMLQRPYDYQENRRINLSATLSNQALGYMFRLAFEYDVLKNGTWVKEIRDVPLSYSSLNSGTTTTAMYPTLVRRSTSSFTSRGSTPLESMQYPITAYRETIKLLFDLYGSANLRMQRVLVLLIQADVPFFTYYSLANNFQDRYTIRVDQPDYSNLNGSLGFFGSMTVDTLSYPLPFNLSPR